MGIFSLFSVVSPAHIWFVTLFSGAKKTGTDSFGNSYYEAAPRKGYKRPRRWVVYNGEADASRVPPEWHGWLHFQNPDPPSDISYRRAWQKPYTPNATGTAAAYRPKGHLLNGGTRDPATGDYESWTPPQ
jgi:NADH:ubiquinone oxidoreductase subunit